MFKDDYVAAELKNRRSREGAVIRGFCLAIYSDSNNRGKFTNSAIPLRWIYGFGRTYWCLSVMHGTRNGTRLSPVALNGQCLFTFSSSRDRLNHHDKPRLAWRTLKTIWPPWVDRSGSKFPHRPTPCR